MRILFLTSAHNSLSQRLLIELTERGHEIRVCVVASGEAMIDAVCGDAPDLIIAPMLKIAIPEEISSRYLCLIVHPGIIGRPRPVLARLGHRQSRKELGRDDPGGGSRVRRGTDLGVA